MNVFKKNTPNWKISELEEEIQNFSKFIKKDQLKKYPWDEISAYANNLFYFKKD